MKRIRIAGLCLAAIFAFAAGAAATASAAPEWWACEPMPGTGNFQNSKCTVPVGGTGNFELKAGIGNGKEFNGKGELAVLHIVIPNKGDAKIECKSFKDKGSVAVPNKELGVTIEFKKCRALGVPCNSLGAKKETIKTNALAGELGYLSGSGPIVGVSLTDEANPGAGYLAEFECTGLAKVRVSGYAIGEQLLDINVLTKNSETVFGVANYLGEPEPGYKPLTNPPAFTSGPVGVLMTELNGPETGNEWSPPIPSGLELRSKQKGENLKVNA